MPDEARPKTGIDHHDPVLLPGQDGVETAGLDRRSQRHRRARAAPGGPLAELPFSTFAHSLRHGFATNRTPRRATDIEIADQGRWSRHSRTLTEYLHREDRWSSTAEAKLGL